jgi:Ni/Co efflux regulator RcnB
MSIRIIALSAAAFALAAPGMALAKPETHGQAHHGAAAHANHGKPVKSSKRASSGKRYAGHACPPGLAKKYPGCIPPGQWKKGYRVPATWSGYYVSYSRLPDYYRDRYQPNPGYRYLYQDGRVLVIDAVTRAVVNILVR